MNTSNLTFFQTLKPFLDLEKVDYETNISPHFINAYPSLSLSYFLFPFIARYKESDYFVKFSLSILEEFQHLDHIENVDKVTYQRDLSKLEDRLKELSVKATFAKFTEQLMRDL
ncbi:hypothetical protein JOC77_002971 [Peribacillus deserti]|uniref:Uncharacterized protein n=1 Tax=Peribacillus deserti TaxID=673318 RepID=A0ABS2QK52_9BACI|nr:hypothetical protein [Peribacillus deserti]MBM7693531.1 hypothetical protein [Peribacillus deserti]